MAKAKSVSVFFQSGRMAGLCRAQVGIDAALELADLIGTTPLTIAAYTAARADWVKGYAGGNECTEKRAENAWAEIFKLTGLVKPQTVEAARKAAVRKAAKVADKVNPAGKPATTAKAPTKGADAASSAKEARTWALNATEENLITWFREGKFAMIGALISAQATK